MSVSQSERERERERERENKFERERENKFERERQSVRVKERDREGEFHSKPNQSSIEGPNVLCVVVVVVETENVETKSCGETFKTQFYFFVKISSNVWPI